MLQRPERSSPGGPWENPAKGSNKVGCSLHHQLLKGQKRGHLLTLAGNQMRRCLCTPKRRQHRLMTRFGQLLERGGGVPLGSDPELFSSASV